MLQTNSLFQTAIENYTTEQIARVKFVKTRLDHQVKTIIMGASFRNIDQITELACDKLTISPALLEVISKK